jgi:hypothetical protein
MKRSRIHPLAKGVKDQFESIRDLIHVFFQPDVPFNGLIICGAAGMGKTHIVTKTLDELGINEKNKNYHLIKGQVSSGQFYIDLYMNHKKGMVVVVDDADIIGQNKPEMNSIIDFMKSATDVKYGKREVQRNKVNLNQKMKTLDVPERFDFQGSLIWITNEVPSGLSSKLKGHWEALSSRCNVYTLQFDDETKFNYTKHLIEEEDIYGENCYDKPGGFSDKQIETLLDFMEKNHKQLKDWTPRRSFKMIVQIQILEKMGKNPDEIEKVLVASSLNQ